MDYFKRFLKNMGLMLALFVILLIFSPALMSDAINVLGEIFGPLLFIGVIVAALPKKKS